APQLVRSGHVRPALHRQDVHRDGGRDEQARRSGQRPREDREVLGGPQELRRGDRRDHDERARRQRRADLGAHGQEGRLHALRVATHVTAPTLPILPTSVVGSYSIPAWLWAAWEKIEAGGFGVLDVTETENDAVAVAVRDQERAGLDLISDGEMRRQGFIVSIFKYFHGLKPIEPRRKVGVLSYDGHVIYEPVERITAPAGLGTLGELD